MEMETPKGFLDKPVGVARDGNRFFQRTKFLRSDDILRKEGCHSEKNERKRSIREMKKCSFSKTNEKINN